MSKQNTQDAGYFITVDAETEFIEPGVGILAQIREEVEKSENIRIPITWFVRFQRGWDESVMNDDPTYFTQPMTSEYDGYALLNTMLPELQRRGDEIAWHYHAYHYVRREDLSHETRIEVLKHDLATCGHELQRRYPEFGIRSFRFGWFFIPSYELYATLREVGIDIDASVSPERAGTKVNVFNCHYLDPITTYPKSIDGTTYVPRNQTLLIHDYNVVPHQFNWHQQDANEAAAKQDQFRSELVRCATKLKPQNGGFTTYQEFVSTA